VTNFSAKCNKHHFQNVIKLTMNCLFVGIRCFLIYKENANVFSMYMNERLLSKHNKSAIHRFNKIAIHQFFSH